MFFFGRNVLKIAELGQILILPILHLRIWFFIFSCLSKNVTVLTAFSSCFCSVWVSYHMACWIKGCEYQAVNNIWCRKNPTHLILQSTQVGTSKQKQKLFSYCSIFLKHYTVSPWTTPAGETKGACIGKWWWFPAPGDGGRLANHCCSFHMCVAEIKRITALQLIMCKGYPFSHGSFGYPFCV